MGNDIMVEYFVFDVDRRFTGEVMSTTDEEGIEFDDLREATSQHIFEGSPETARMFVGFYTKGWTEHR